MSIYLINDETMGGDAVLGKKLMGSFLKKLWANCNSVDKLIFYNAGVKLLTKQAGHLDAMHGLNDKGVELLACGTCVDYYGIREQIEIGFISNMETIVDLMNRADKVITL